MFYSFYLTFILLSSKKCVAIFKIKNINVNTVTVSTTVLFFRKLTIETAIVD